VLRARAGWIAAVLLIAMAFLGGPDPLTGHSRPAQAAATSAVERDNRVGDDLDPPGSVTEHLVLGRRRVPGLPPSQQTDTVPAAGQTGAGPAPVTAAAGSITGRDRARRLPDRTPASLQVFRC
jgi:hypothetical protein